MSKRKSGSYLGGHTVLTQRRSDFERTLSDDAAKVIEKKRIAQIKFDKELTARIKRDDKVAETVVIDGVAKSHRPKRVKESERRINIIRSQATHHHSKGFRVNSGKLAKHPKMICRFPDCDCKVDFPDDYRPNADTPCPKCDEHGGWLK